MSREERLGLGHVFNMYCWPKVKRLQTFTTSKIIYQQVLINLTRKIFQKKGHAPKGSSPLRNDICTPLSCS